MTETNVASPDAGDRRDRFFASVLSRATDVAVVCSAELTVRWISPSIRTICGHDPAGVVGLNMADFVHPDDRAALLATVDRVLAHPDEHQVVELRMRHTDGVYHWCEQRISNQLDDDAVRGLVVNSADAESLRATNERLRAREHFLQLLLDTAHEGVWVLDWEARTRFANPRMAELLSTSPEDMVGRPVEDLVDQALANEIRNRLTRRRAGLTETYEMEIRTPGGARVWTSVSAAPLPPGYAEEVPDGGTIALVSDISDRKAREEALRQQMLYDPLTGLPNRMLLEEELRKLEVRKERLGENFSYLSCDISGLTLINSALGSLSGDDLIREVARRLAEAVRAGDMVVRTTGDQFVVLCPNTEVYQARRIAQDLVKDVEGRFELAGSPVYPTISIGAASSSDVEAPALASAAGTALAQAKKHGRGSVVIFDAAAPKDHRSALSMLADLREAITSGGLQLHYQPVVHLASNEVTGVEALVRWNRPGHGDIAPALFVPLAEEEGLIAALGDWSFRQACSDAVLWPGNRGVAVNLSARQLTSDTVASIEAALQDTGLSPGRLWVEVTETGLFADLPAAARHLEAISALGVRVSLDDFGTGYSSLTYLRDFPVHSLKIDRSFVAGVDTNPDDNAIVAALVSLAGSLGLHVVAEGIERGTQLSTLRRLGCQLGQGYLLGRPVPVDELRMLVSRLEARGPLIDVALRPRSGRSLEDVDPAIRGRIIAMHRGGASPSTIAAVLNSEGITAPSGRRWHRVTVAHVVAANMRFEA